MRPARLDDPEDLACSFKRSGALHEDAELLAVGAGHAGRSVLAGNHVGRIVATGIYGEATFAGANRKAPCSRTQAWTSIYLPLEKPPS